MLAIGVTASAQVTTGTVSGTIKDSTGGVLPGATVTLISESRGTRMAPVMTSSTGDFVAPNITSDTYTIEVTMPSFKTLTRKGIQVSSADRVAVGVAGARSGRSQRDHLRRGGRPVIQSQSGDRSFTVTTATVENLPILSRNYASLAELAPGVSHDPGRGDLVRIGGEARATTSWTASRSSTPGAAASGFR